MKKALILFALVYFCGAGVAAAQSFTDFSSFFGAGASAPAKPASALDLLYDADSYTPPFYRGRPQASPGSTMHFQAVAHFTGAGGAAVPDSAIIYTWKRDGEVLGSISGKGRSSAAIASPSLFGSNVIEVDAQSADASAYGSAEMTVSSVDPSVTLYQDHPLFGIEFYKALDGSTLISDQEMTFVGVPYFAAAASPNQGSLNWAWSVNGGIVPATTTNANELTINAGASGGQASIGVSLTSSQNPLLDAQGNWQVIFSPGAH